MARTIIRSKPKKKRVRISFRERAEMRRKGSKTPTEQKYAPAQMPRDNGLNMRVKIRRKTK